MRPRHSFRRRGWHTDAGRAWVYEWVGGRWQQLGPGLMGNDEFGDAVSISADGSRIAVSTSTAASAAGKQRAGSVLVYQWSGSAWTQLGGTIDGKAAVDNAGGSISLSSDGSRIAIGSRHNKDGGVAGGGAAAGHVRVFQLAGSTWSQLGHDLVGGIAANGADNFGYSVSLSGDGTRLVAGGPGTSVVRAYRLEGGKWAQVAVPFKQGGRTGEAVAISADGTAAATGAVYHPGPLGAAQGIVRIYTWP